MLSIDSDLGRHLTLGHYILNNRVVPSVDIFSHTLGGHPRPPYEWLTQVLFALADRLAGLDGVILLVSLFIAVAFSYVYGQAVKKSGLPLMTLALSILALAASSLHWLPRPHVVTFLFLAILLERLEALQNGEPVPIWQFPAIMFFWANMHGGFIFGFLVWLAYLAGAVWDRWIKKEDTNSTIWRKMWIGISLSGVASILTPDGWGNWIAVLSNNSRYILSQTVETMPPNITQIGTWPFFILVFMSVILFLSNWKRVLASHVFLLAGLAFLGLLMARNIPLFAVASVPVLSLWIRDLISSPSRWLKIESHISEIQKPLKSSFWTLLPVAGLMFLIGIRPITQKDALIHFDQRVFPVQAVDWLEEHPQSGHMFNEFNWGGYLLYRLWPEQKVFLDSQTDFYGETLLREYEQVITASRDWEDVLSKYEVSWVILPVQSRLSESLRMDMDWKLLYEDQTAIIARKLP
jgi:hypothetical protein